MIFPVRCFTCGKPIGHLWEKYQEMIKKGSSPKEALDKLGVKRFCCRAIFISHIEAIDKVMKFKKG